jgi:apolipoprotein D and lipocalin family protein
MKIAKYAQLSAGALSGIAAFGLAACSGMPLEPLPRAESLDLSKFMGQWYVIAQIAPSSVGDSYNGEEQYALNADDEIDTLYSYRKGGFDGKLKKSNTTGFVVDGTGNAEWGMQIFWPLKLEYVVSYVDADYQTTIIARSKRDYVWLMSRTPQINDVQYAEMVERIKSLGYDTLNLRKEPQQTLSDRK